MDASQGPLGTLGPYVLEAVLGRGGMGVVYRARDMRRGRIVALKLLSDYLANDERFVSRFRRESRIAAQLNDPHVIPIHDFGEIDGRLYIDMRFVDGIDLAQLLTARGPLPVGLAVEILGQVAGALDAAHRDGLVHRDIKPANILLAGPVDPSRTPFAYLVDFGIARAAASAEITEISTTTNTVGTISYMAPERLTGEPGDHHTDIYSLGCVLFELITGHKPFEGEPAALMYAHINSAPPDPRAFVRSIPAGIGTAIAHAMAKNPAERFPTAGQFADATRRALSPDQIATDQVTAPPNDESTVRYPEVPPAAPRPEDATASFRIPSDPGRGPVPGPGYPQAPGYAGPDRTPGYPAGQTPTPPGYPAPGYPGQQPPGYPPGSGPTPAPRRRRLPVLIGALVVVAAVVVAVVLVMTSGGKSPQAGPTSSPTNGPQHTQFTSAQLYAFARPFVENMTCVDNPSADDAPLGSTVAHVELVKCTGAQYSATFLLFKDQQQLLAGRQAFLGKASGAVHTLTTGPKTEPQFSYGRSYKRRQNGDELGRVYWESGGTLCSGELQGLTGQSPSTMVDYWHSK